MNCSPESMKSNRGPSNPCFWVPCEPSYEPRSVRGTGANYGELLAGLRVNVLTCERVKVSRLPDELQPNQCKWSDQSPMLPYTFTRPHDHTFTPPTSRYRTG